MSGIDGSGKSYAAARMARALRHKGHAVASLSVDGWLNLPSVRFSQVDPAEHFYRHAIRFEAMFAELLLPLRRDRRIRLEADYTEEQATRYRKQRYEFDDVDVILVEGIYLLKRELRPHYDLALWIECGFETALERAIARGQEGLGREETSRAYHTIYFPAQEIHFRIDRPRESADHVLWNDPRLSRG